MSFWLVQNHSDFLDLNIFTKDSRQAGMTMTLKLYSQ